jgi:hypothetical protein
MPIYKYGPGDHPAGWQGLRVCVHIGGEGLRQEYFSFYDADGFLLSKAEQACQRKKARALEAAWLKEQNRNARCRLQEAKPTRNTGPGATGVSGISAALAVSQKRRGGEIRHYRYPAFVVQSRHNGKLLSRKISARAYPESAWRTACQLLAEHKGIDPEPLISRLPDPAGLIGRLEREDS